MSSFFERSTYQLINGLNVFCQLACLFTINAPFWVRSYNPSIPSFPARKSIFASWKWAFNLLRQTRRSYWEWLVVNRLTCMHRSDLASHSSARLISTLTTEAVCWSGSTITSLAYNNKGATATEKCFLLSVSLESFCANLLLTWDLRRTLLFVRILNKRN